MVIDYKTNQYKPTSSIIYIKLAMRHSIKTFKKSRLFV